jgi:hypothetical protein
LVSGETNFLRKLEPGGNDMAKAFAPAGELAANRSTSGRLDRGGA